jgi:hypothetical protein
MKVEYRDYQVKPLTKQETVKLSLDHQRHCARLMRDFAKLVKMGKPKKGGIKY